MKKHSFLLYCVVLTFAYTQAHLYFRHKFSGIEQLRLRVGILERDIEREKLRAALSVHQLSEYRQYVATLMPGALRQKNDDLTAYRLRTLASVVTAADSDKLALERGAGHFEKAKGLFRDGQFEDAGNAFRELIDSFPESVHVAEAHFLLAEAQFQMKEYENCIETIESMIALFPDSELTGFALLRLGKIFEYQDRLEDAVEIYRTVLASYKDQPLLTQARLSLKAVEL